MKKNIIFLAWACIVFSPFCHAIQCGDEQKVKYGVYVKEVGAVAFHSNIVATFAEDQTDNSKLFHMIVYPTNTVYQQLLQRLLTLSMFNKTSVITVCYEEQGEGINNSYIYSANIKRP